MSERNQCDGCALGMAVSKNGNHIDASGRIHMGCTRDRYEASETEQLRARVAELERERDEVKERMEIVLRAGPKTALAEAVFRRAIRAEHRVAELAAVLKGVRAFVTEMSAQERIDEALAGIVHTVDTIVANAVETEREAREAAEHRVAELERERDEYRRGIRAVRAFYCIEYLPDGTDLIAGASASDEVNATLDGVRGAMAEADGVVESHRHADSRVTELERERDEARRRVAELEAVLREARDDLQLWRHYGHGRGADVTHTIGVIADIDTALSGTAPALDSAIAAAVRAEREACAESAAAAPIRCAHVTCHACRNPAAAAIRARGEGTHSASCRTVTGKVNDGYCVACRREATERERGMCEPFCACGRRTSECDGSRAGCGKSPSIRARGES